VSAFFVTATGTDIGKTYVTAGLVRHLRARGAAAEALKPVLSGFEPARGKESDAGVLLGAMDRLASANEIERVSPWRFAAPLSPDMAAAREGRPLDFNAVVDFCRAAIARAPRPLFIEGAGGVMTPLTQRDTMLDLAVLLRIPTILVTGSYLGAISHTLTAMTAMRQRDVHVAALVISESANGTVPLADTADAIGRFVSGVPITVLTRPAREMDFAVLAGVLQVNVTMVR
jgi:dethiobiotin synthetase